MFYRLLYKSASTIPEEHLESALQSIAMACDRNNPTENVTGALVYHGGSFAQLLEGGRSAISNTLKRLMNDPRHRNVELLMMDETNKREFAQFSMLIVRAEGVLSVEMAEYTVGQAFSIDALSPESLTAFLISIGSPSSLQARSQLAQEASFDPPWRQTGVDRRSLG